MTDSNHPDTLSVRRALTDDLRVHVRIRDQGNDPDDALRNTLAEALPALVAFGEHNFHGVRVLLDWDHQIPSQFALLRIMACYTAADLERVDAVIADREAEIQDGNLYPEFDVPDYGDIDASENYVALLRPGATEVEDFRFMSAWRKQVTTSVADRAVTTVKAHPGYKLVTETRTGEGLGGPVVIGWAPPSLAEAGGWAIEIWLLTEFDGQTGKARVFMVDLDNDAVTREFDTDVQLA